MKLTEREALEKFSAHDHGTLSTFHPTRGIDSVPAVYAFDGQFVGIPVDRIKPILDAPATTGQRGPRSARDATGRPVGLERLVEVVVGPRPP